MKRFLGLAIVVFVAGIADAGDAVAQAWARVGGPTEGPARIYGSYSEGCLVGGVALPLDGPGHQVIRPSRRRHYGHPILVDYMERLGERVAQAGLGLALVADMAQPRGGPISGHVSHETGLDIDIWLDLSLPRMSDAERESITATVMVDAATGAVDPSVWTDDQMQLIRLAATDLRVARIFVNPAIKRALCEREWSDPSWLRVVVPWTGHDSHMHVRLNCPADDSSCEGQAPPADGSGCGEELENWSPDTARNEMYVSGSVPRPPGVLPRQCIGVHQMPTAP